MKNIIKVLLLVSISTAYASQAPNKFLPDTKCQKEREQALKRCLGRSITNLSDKSHQAGVAALCYAGAYAQFVRCMQRNNNSVVTK